MGAGIFGLSCAWAAARRGARVRVIDPAGIGAGASGGVVGALAPHAPGDWDALKLFQLEALAMAPDWWAAVAEAGGGDPGYARTGRLQPLPTDAAVRKARARVAEAAARIKAAGGQAAITISDPFCAERHRADFQRLIAGDVDIAIGNVAEWLTLYQTEDLEEALGRASEACRTVACTRSGESVIAIRDGQRAEAPVERVVPVDATGAGDQFAAGFLYGLATGRDLEVAARMGVMCAAEVIGHIGPRPEADMGARFREVGLI